MIDPENADAPVAIERIKGRINSMSRSYRDASRRLETIDLFEKAVTAFVEGKYEDAISLARQVLQRDAAHEDAKDLINRAERRMKPLSDEENEQIRTLHIEAMKHYTQKEYAEAIDAWEKILDIDPDNESARKNIEEAKQRLRKLGSSEGG